jgi:hypothetical protein
MNAPQPTTIGVAGAELSHSPAAATCPSLCHCRTQ